MMTPTAAATTTEPLHTPTRSSRHHQHGGTAAAVVSVVNREQVVRAWLLKYLPTLREDDLNLYTHRLVEDGFDSVDMLEHELVEDDLAFMRKAHKRSMGRKKNFEG